MHRSSSAPASNTEMVSRFVAEWSARTRTAERPRGAFVLDDAPLSDDDVSSPDALLPAMVWHADNMYRYAINARGLGAVYQADGEALLGRRVELDRIHRSTSELLCFVLEALEDAQSHLPASKAVRGAVELRSHVNQFAAAMGTSIAAVPSPAPAGPARPQG